MDYEKAFYTLEIGQFRTPCSNVLLTSQTEVMRWHRYYGRPAPASRRPAKTKSMGWRRRVRREDLISPKLSNIALEEVFRGSFASMTLSV